ncbi:zinc metallopeptidase [Candidatus Dojkabacteria bacterium]|uniref:Zinc metallopeptidase n=1 Tax=Candidatus Dojkabacteria bacterium TaxID=2099670 RepID=A0A955L118_9BACT|nr:zinc metallopeptidase [Candidatus Dojkabacteria bacterium]
MIFSPVYLLFIIPGLIVGLIAQFFLWYAYSKFSRISAKSGVTGMEAAKIINEGEGFGVGFMTSPGKLNDHYNPASHIVNISSDNATNTSVANIAVVAHEFGHVQQKEVGSALFAIRSELVPAVNLGSNLGYILMAIGFVISFFELSIVGLTLFSLTTIFSLVTLPIEIDASRRGMNLLRKYNLVAVDQLGGARAVLSAAAMTYVAALISSLGQLLYFFMRVQGSRR